MKEAKVLGNAACGSPALSTARILLVDDQESVLVLLKHLLKEAGFTHVLCVDDARRALAQVAVFQPDLALLDVNMPFLSGVEVLASLRTGQQPLDYLPVVIMTSLGGDDIRLQALQAGVSDNFPGLNSTITNYRF